jgi:crotonobetainyl-CoA:carnitine CoA-transferase CaiB-like acyl-CoA transferase
LCGAIDAPDLLADERFIDNVARLANREVMIAELEKRFARQPAQHWIEALRAAGVPAAPIVDYAQALSSEQAQARNMVMEVEHPVEGPIKMLGYPVKASGGAQQLRYPPPLLGEHTAQVLNEFGFDEAAIGRLRDMGAFGQ